MYVVDYISQDLIFYANPEAVHTWEARGSLDAPPVTNVAEGEMTRRSVRRHEPLAVELSEFARAVRDGLPSPVDPHDALVALLLARKMVEAGESGTVIGGPQLSEALA
jgi:predicted dehydrogenase